MSKRNVVAFLVCVAIIGAGVLIILWAKHRAAATQEKNEKRLTPAVSVEFIRLVPQSVEDRLTLTGSVAPWKDVTISAEVGGKIEARYIEQGDPVKKDQDLFHINTQVLQTRLRQARAQAKLAEQDYQRAVRLNAKGVSAERDLDSAIAARDVAEAEVKTIEIQVEKSVVKAPFDGVADRCFKEENEYTDVGAPLVRLVQLNPAKVFVNIPERDVPAFKVGDIARVRVDAYGQEVFEGRIHRISTTAEAGTRTFFTEITVNNEDGRLRPGMVARVDLIRKVFPESIVVPIFSTFLLDDQRYVAVIQDGKAQIRAISTGIVQGGLVQVTKGLSAGDMLIVKGQYDVRDGDPVTAREANQ